MKISKFPLIELEGSPTEIGIKHGSVLKEKIHSTIDWYKTIIKREVDEVINITSHFKSVINSFNSEYGKEIEGIALGAEVDPIWIYMLNSRSEIMNTFRNECTAAFFKHNSLLGQNWDWAEALEKLGVILRIKQEKKPEILMMTEPGIIGKIGMNSSGVGVCLNFLDSGKMCDGVPIHIILRAVLDSFTIEGVKQNIDPGLLGKSANVLIGDKFGKFLNIEFANDDIYYSDSVEDAFLHTNHYLKNELLNLNKEKLTSSFARYSKGVELIKGFDTFSIDELKTILLDQSHPALPICRPYVEDPDLGNVGTICTILMDLRKSQLHITQGSPLNSPFTTLNISKE
ncbi:MAG: C45 family autoproteolytic acyltransferase/hydrolase [Candidatus Kariarchaeaceae archaeon]|jgi:isopenicillin-N N-acyltransferase-like protein